MSKFKKLAMASAVSLAMFGTTAAEAHVSYHLPVTGTDAPNDNGTVDLGSWTGGSPTAVGKDYAGTLPVTWIANVHHEDTNYLVSSADAVSKGAANGYSLSSVNNKWTPASSWGTALDFGLLNLEVGGNLKIEIAADSSLSSEFAPGFTLFYGWDAGTGNKHQAWNANPSAPSTLDASGLLYLDHASTTIAGGVASLTFNNVTAGHYTLFIGGNGASNNKQTYLANISVASVPVPGAVWLFASAIAGMVGFGRRKVAA